MSGKQRKVRFIDVSVGERFFDPDSGEFFVKVDATTARCDSGGDALEGETDTFDAYDPVDV